MIQITLRQLTYFAAAAKAGSTRRAAEALRVSQPAISVAIGHLEDHFGQKLFIRRHAQGVDLTSFGHRKLVEVRHLLAHVNAVALSGAEGALSGQLELGVFSTFAPFFAPALLKAFAEAHPDVRIHMRELDLDGIRRDVDGGLVELALLYDLDIGVSMTREHLATFPPYALLPAGHPLCAGAEVSLADLSAETYVLIDLPHSRDYFLSLFRYAGVEPKQIVRCTSLETVRGMVAHGLGVSILVTRPSGDVSYDGLPLVCRPISDRLPPQRLVLGWSERVSPTPLVEAFVAVAKAYFATRQTLVEGRPEASE